MGRPSKATQVRLEALLAALRAGSTRDAAAAHAGINRTTLYRWLARKPGLRAQLEAAEADAQLSFEAIVAQAARSEWRAATWWLSHRRAAIYGRERTVAPETAPAPHPLDGVAPADAARWAEAYAADLAAQAVPPREGSTPA